MQVSLRYSF